MSQSKHVELLPYYISIGLTVIGAILGIVGFVRPHGLAYDLAKFLMNTGVVFFLFGALLAGYASIKKQGK